MSKMKKPKKTRPGHKRPLRWACEKIGYGDFRAGRKIIYRIAERLEHARAKHPVFAEGAAEAVSVIMDEAREMEHAMKRETPERMFDEALDVVVTCLRLLNGEDKCNGE